MIPASWTTGSFVADWLIFATGMIVFELLFVIGILDAIRQNLLDARQKPPSRE